MPFWAGVGGWGVGSFAAAEVGLGGGLISALFSSRGGGLFSALPGWLSFLAGEGVGGVLLFFLFFFLTGFFLLASVSWISRRELPFIRLDFVLVRLSFVGFEKFRFASRSIDGEPARGLEIRGV
jgi:hypothetical protein